MDGAMGWVVRLIGAHGWNHDRKNLFWGYQVGRNQE
jgi:hypothetical protein